MQNNITTGRLFLEILTEEDYEFIIQLVNSKGWIEFIGDRNVHSKEEAIAYINKILNADNIYYWVVRMKDQEIPIGIVTLLKREYLEYFDIGFAFLPEFSGHGYAYEATKELLSVIRTNPGYNQILAITLPGNINSIKLLSKLGLHFQREHIEGDENLLIYTT